MKVLAKKSFAVGRRVIRKGNRYEQDDPAVKGYPDFFESADEFFGVEKATANPGEARNAKKPKNVCDECGFEAKTAAGLGVHERSHDEE